MEDRGLAIEIVKGLAAHYDSSVALLRDRYPFSGLGDMHEEMAKALRTLLEALEAQRLLLAEAVEYAGYDFEHDHPVNGGDLIEWFAEWRARAALAGGGVRT